MKTTNVFPISNVIIFGQPKIEGTKVFKMIVIADTSSAPNVNESGAFKLTVNQAARFLDASPFGSYDELNLALQNPAGYSITVESEQKKAGEKYIRKDKSEGVYTSDFVKTQITRVNAPAHVVAKKEQLVAQTAQQTALVQSLLQSGALSEQAVANAIFGGAMTQTAAPAAAPVAVDPVDAQADPVQIG